MRSVIFIVASLALLAICVCTPEKEPIQHIPAKVGETPSVTNKGGARSGAAGDASGASSPLAASRHRRDVGGQESDLIPSANDVDASPFGETSNLDGRGRIKVLPAYLG